MLPKGKRFPPIIETNDPAPFEKTCYTQATENRSNSAHKLYIHLIGS